MAPLNNGEGLPEFPYSQAVPAKPPQPCRAPLLPAPRLWHPAPAFPTIAAMRVSTRNTKVVFFVTLGACLVAVAAALNVGWIILNWREVAVLVLGIVFFLA